MRLACHPDNGPAVLDPARLQRLLADRSRNSVRNGGDAITVDALGHEIITDRTGSPLSERLVRPGVSPLIRIALDEDARAPIRCEPRGGPVEVTPRRRAELKAVAIGWSAKRQILGKTVYNEKNVRVGRIDDIIVTPERAVSYVIIGAGGFVGLGRHDVAIPINQLQEQDGKYVLSGATKEAIKALPKFEYAKK